MSRNRIIEFINSKIIIIIIIRSINNRKNKLSNNIFLKNKEIK